MLPIRVACPKRRQSLKRFRFSDIPALKFLFLWNFTQFACDATWEMTFRAKCFAPRVRPVSRHEVTQGNMPLINVHRTTRHLQTLKEIHPRFGLFFEKVNPTFFFFSFPPFFSFVTPLSKFIIATWKIYSFRFTYPICRNNDRIIKRSKYSGCNTAKFYILKKKKTKRKWRDTVSNTKIWWVLYSTTLSSSIISFDRRAIDV